MRKFLFIGIHITALSGLILAGCGGGGSDESDSGDANTGWYTTGQPGDLMLSGIGFNQTGGPLLFNHPKGVETDGTRLYLVDGNNNRVLIWNTLPDGANDEPDVVLGQLTFETNEAGTGLDGMNWPMSICVASQAGPLLVADTYNNRILVWNEIPTESGQAADYAIEGHDRDSNQPMSESTKGNFVWPWGVWSDGTRLVITSTAKSIYGGISFGGWTLIWDELPTGYGALKSPDEPAAGHDTWAEADRILTGNGKIGTPRTITTDGDTLMIGDHNAVGQSESHGTWVWKSWPTQDEQEPDYFLTTENAGHWLQGDYAFDGRLIMTGGSRNEAILIWNETPAAADTPPDIALKTYPYGYRGGDGVDTAIAGGKLFVSDPNGNRVLVYQPIPGYASQEPAFAIGAPDLETNTLDTNYFVTNPIMASNGESFFLASNYDCKILGWKQTPADSGVAPDMQYSENLEAATQIVAHGNTLAFSRGGQLTGTNGGEIHIWTQLDDFWNGMEPDTVMTSLNGVALEQVMGIAMNDQYFFVSEVTSYGSLLHVFEGVPGDAATPKWSIPLNYSATQLCLDGSTLFMNSDQMLLFDLETLSESSVPDTITLGDSELFSGNFKQAILAGGSFYIADFGYHRVYAWKSLHDAMAGLEPDTIIGATGADDFQPEVDQDSLFWPTNLMHDGERLWVGEYKFSGRVIGYEMK